jgi:hypothetical protein
MYDLICDSAVCMQKIVCLFCMGNQSRVLRNQLIARSKLSAACNNERFVIGKVSYALFYGMKPVLCFFKEPVITLRLCFAESFL